MREKYSCEREIKSKCARLATGLLAVLQTCSLGRRSLCCFPGVPQVNSLRHILGRARAEERMGGETSQLALARRVMRGVLAESARGQEN